MCDEVPATARRPRRLACVFDAFPPGTPPSLDDLELAMSRDTERRTLDALDHALGRLATSNSDGSCQRPAASQHRPRPTDRGPRRFNVANE